jgi:hypothetical protein
MTAAIDAICSGIFYVLMAFAYLAIIATILAMYYGYIRSSIYLFVRGARLVNLIRGNEQTSEDVITYAGTMFVWLSLLPLFLMGIKWAIINIPLGLHAAFST